MIYTVKEFKISQSPRTQERFVNCYELLLYSKTEINGWFHLDVHISVMNTFCELRPALYVSN